MRRDEIEVAEDVGEGIVDLVRDRGRESPHRREALGLQEAKLHVRALGDVDRHADRAVDLARGVAQRCERGLEHDGTEWTLYGELFPREHAIRVRERHAIALVEVEARAAEQLLGTKPETLEAASLGERDDPVPIEGEEN